VGVEPTIRLAKSRIAGFEDREGHRTPFASVLARSTRYKAYWMLATVLASQTLSSAIVVPVAVRETASCRLAIERCARLLVIASVCVRATRRYFRETSQIVAIGWRTCDVDHASGSL
jgi:hypothetical protein